MLNDIKAPPIDLDEPTPAPRLKPVYRAVEQVPVDERVDSPTHASLHLKPNVDRNEPGLHRARYLGERGTTDLVYDLPLEDRASGFSIGLSIAVTLLVVSLVIWCAFTLLR